MNSESPMAGTGGSQLEATLEIREEIARGEAVSVKFELSNRANEDLDVLGWYTPLEGLAGEIFHVERDGEPIPYTGLMAKRGVPLPEEFVSIERGGSLSAEVDLATSYDFSMPGDYTIEYLSPPISQVVSKQAAKATRQSDLGPVQIASEAVSVRIVESGAAGDEPAPEAPPPAKEDFEVAKQITYDDCSASQESTVGSADVSANVKSAFVHAYLNGLSVAERQTNALYKRWYGAYTATRYAKVLGKWKKITDGFASNITYNCKGPACKSNWIAYVYKGGKLEVFLCNLYWSAPDTGTDTKYGTLIHEVSHEAADTHDHAYGMTNCLNLATNDPDKAVENADTYQYFAEEYELKVGSAHLKLTMLSIGAALLAEGVRRYRKSRSAEA